MQKLSILPWQPNLPKNSESKIFNWVSLVLGIGTYNFVCLFIRFYKPLFTQCLALYSIYLANFRFTHTGYKQKNGKKLTHSLMDFISSFSLNAVRFKEFFRTCNVLPFSCTHLALWRGKEEGLKLWLTIWEERKFDFTPAPQPWFCHPCT